MYISSVKGLITVQKVAPLILISYLTEINAFTLRRFLSDIMFATFS